MSRILVRVNGFIGDCLFASSIAERLIAQEGEGTEVDFAIPLPQPFLLLKSNPYIHDVFIGSPPAGYQCDREVFTGFVDQSVPATVWMQKQVGVKDPTVGYQVYTLPEHDAVWAPQAQEMRKKYPGMPLVAWQANWRERAYPTTWEQYDRHTFTDGAHRDIDHILGILTEKLILVEVGLPNGVRQTESKAQDALLYSSTASFIKQCDWMIGAEGGLTNLAAGMGVRCIITTDFIGQVYGPNGQVKQIPNPQMGPAVYFPKGGHSHLEPFITDDEVAKRILQIIDSKVSTVFDWVTRTERGVIYTEQLKSIGDPVGEIISGRISDDKDRFTL